MAFLFRAIGTISFLFLVLFVGIVRLDQLLSFIRYSSSQFQLDYIINIFALPFVGLLITVICFGIAQIAARQQRIMRAIAAAQQRRRAASVPTSVKVEQPPIHIDVHVPTMQRIRSRRSDKSETQRSVYRWSKYPEPRPNPKDPYVAELEKPQPMRPEPPRAR